MNISMRHWVFVLFNEESYQVLQATEVWVMIGLVMVHGQSVMVRVVA